ncbi:Rieske (2Fe-2S) protein [Euzebya sp.]|uniref:Rieske (2Fe-2S) protein n=1 Tax=Euzebya sp. TaxID=1971409 RepID=UPI003511E9B0
MSVDVRVGPLADLPADRCIAVGDGRAVVVRVDSDVVAFANRCLHKDSPLAGGRVFGGALTCPLHFWRYDLPDGAHRGGSGRLPRYPTRVEDGEVVVVLPDPPPAIGLREQLLARAREWSRDPGARP